MNRVNVKLKGDYSGQPLSPREIQIAEMVSEGLTTGEIAEQLGRSPHTVEQYCKNISVKTGYRKVQYWKLRVDQTTTSPSE